MIYLCYNNLNEVYVMKRISEKSDCYVIANVCLCIFLILSATFVCYYLLLPLFIIGLFNIANFVNGDVIISLSEAFNLYIMMLSEPFNLLNDILSRGVLIFCITTWLISGLMYLMFFIYENRK